MDQLDHLELMVVQEIEENLDYLDPRVIGEQRYIQKHAVCYIMSAVFQGERGLRGQAGQDGRPGERVSVFVCVCLNVDCCVLLLIREILE